MRKLGFVGGGNMATALIRGILAAKRLQARDVWLTEPLAARRTALRKAHGIGIAASNAELVAGSELVVLAVKPQILPEVLEEIADHAGPRTVFVSIAAGVSLSTLAAALGPKARLVRVMPNTPALVGKGMSVLVRGGKATAADERAALDLFRAVGEAIAVREERHLDAVTGLSGSGPAFVYRFAEALIEGGVAEGLPPKIATQLAYQTLEGAAVMLRETGLSPQKLREMVSSPGGTTVAGLGHLEKRKFGAIVAKTVGVAARRSRELGKGRS